MEVGCLGGIAPLPRGIPVQQIVDPLLAGSYEFLFRNLILIPPDDHSKIVDIAAVIDYRKARH
jgi:hypothetical protein